MKKVVAMLLVICLLGVAALSDISGIGIVKADEQQDTKLKQISFDDFGISDGDIIGWTAMAGTNTTFEDVVFNGWITLHGDCNRTMLLGNGWNGCELLKGGSRLITRRLCVRVYFFLTRAMARW